MPTAKDVGAAPIASERDREQTPAAASSSPLRSHPALFETALILLLPIAVYFVLQVEPFFIQNGVDPFIYIGYMENPGDLVSRYGYPYYAVRFGLILPLRLFSGVFGVVGGHFALRYVLAVISAGSVYLLGRRLHSRAAGWFAAVLCLSSPVFLRALMTTYSDSTGVPFLLAGVACLLMPSSRRYLWTGASGLLLGLAVHSNPAIAPLLVVSIGARLILQLTRREWRCIVDLCVVAAGVVLVTIAGMSYYALAFGDGDILRPSLRALRLLSGNATTVFRAPSLDWLRFSPHLYLAPIVTIALVVVLCTRRVMAGRWFGRALQAPTADVLVMLIAAQSMFAWQQFVGGNYILETYYYASYLFPFVVMGAVGLMCELSSRPGFGARGVWIATAVLVVVPIARNLFFDDLELWAWPAIPIMATLLALAFVGGRWRPVWSVVGAVGLAGSVVLLAVAPPRGIPTTEGSHFRQDPRYDLAIGNSSTKGLHYLELATELIDVLPKSDQDPGSLVFWYPGSGLIDSLQSTYLWRSSSLQSFGSPMPTLTDQQRQMLLERTPRNLVLLAETPEQIAAGRDAVLATGLEPVDVVDSTLRSGDIELFVERLVFEPAPCDGPWTHDNPFVPAWLGLGPCPVPSGS